PVHVRLLEFLVGVVLCGDHFQAFDGRVDHGVAASEWGLGGDDLDWVRQKPALDEVLHEGRILLPAGRHEEGERQHEPDEPASLLHGASFVSTAGSTVPDIWSLNCWSVIWPDATVRIDSFDALRTASRFPVASRYSIATRRTSAAVALGPETTRM